jgi:hypothetical protein
MRARGGAAASPPWLLPLALACFLLLCEAPTVASSGREQDLGWADAVPNARGAAVAADAAGDIYAAGTVDGVRAGERNATSHAHVVAWTFFSFLLSRHAAVQTGGKKNIAFGGRCDCPPPPAPFSSLRCFYACVLPVCMCVSSKRTRFPHVCKGTLACARGVWELRGSLFGCPRNWCDLAWLCRQAHAGSRGSRGLVAVGRGGQVAVRGGERGRLPGQRRRRQQRRRRRRGGGCTAARA